MQLLSFFYIWSREHPASDRDEPGQHFLTAKTIQLSSKTHRKMRIMRAKYWLSQASSPPRNNKQRNNSIGAAGRAFRVSPLQIVHGVISIHHIRTYWESVFEAWFRTFFFQTVSQFQSRLSTEPAVPKLTISGISGTADCFVYRDFCTRFFVRFNFLRIRQYITTWHLVCWMPSCSRELCRYPEEVLHGRCKPHVQKVQRHSGQVRALQQGLGTVSTS